MNEITPINNIRIEELIYEVRGHHVMIDSDLAKLYGYNGGAKAINKSVKRKAGQFEKEVYFQLSNEEWNNLRFQVGTANGISGTANMIRSLPYVFTLEGIKILSTILRKPNVPMVTLEIEKYFKKLENKNNQSPAIPVSKGENVRNLIYNIRGKQVMLDFDLARIYECKNGTKTAIQAFKRNINRFPEDFYFQLTEEEFLNLKSQIGTSSWNNYGGVRKLPYAFTEPGVYTLASILRTPIANKITSTIMRTFAVMRDFIGENLIEQRYINKLVLEDHERIDILEENLKKFDSEKKEIIFCDGQIYDAYSKIIDIWSKAKEELTIIDGYADKKVLDMISNLSLKVTLIVKEKGNLKDRDIEEYSRQYSNLTLIRDNSFHDRYFILDKSIIFHCGASVNHAGKGIFSITRMTDDVVCASLLTLVENVVKRNTSLLK